MGKDKGSVSGKSGGVVRGMPGGPCFAEGKVACSTLPAEEANDEGNLVIKELALIPFGRVRLDYAVPYSSNTTRDLFSAPFVTTLGTLRSIKERDLTVNGPIPLEYTEKKGFAARWVVQGEAGARQCERVVWADFGKALL
eukprot:1159828-Pelagomonas_calceolata.AAC.5